MQTKIIIKSLSELPKAPSTIGTMAWNQTGDWRYLTPLVADKLAPCSQNCPAGIPIPHYLGAVNRGDVEGGLTLLMAYNPLPGLTGRLCYHPCQTKCVRRKIDLSISIQKMEQFLGDLATSVTIAKSEKTDRRITIIGSGPLGLACAFYLGCRGCRVVVLDPSSQAGGALVGLSPGKIEPQVLSHDINRLICLADIRVETGAVIDFEALRSELPSKADLVILDPTGLSEDIGAPAGAVVCNPFDDKTVSGGIVTVQLPQNLIPFKAPMIAHYIAAGRLVAEKAFGALCREGLEQPAPAALQTVKIENIRIERFPTAVPLAETETQQDGTWDRDRALKEAERCLSCGTCNLCLQCVSYCPDVSIRPDAGKATVAVDLDHCKGCGICAYECPRGVITMEDMSL